MGETDSPPSQKAVMARAAAFVERYSEQLPHLVATETMSQQLTRKLRFLIENVGRQSIAELGWVPVADVHEVIGVRDVVEVDGQRVGASGQRLVDLLHRPGGGTWAEARAILDEGARYNLGPGSRNFNLPTVVVYFLQADRQPRFRWTRRSAASAPLWEIEFRERSRPTVIRTGDGRSVNSRGKVWVETATGNVVRTRLDMKVDGTIYAIDTRFEYVAPMDLVLPVALDERYETGDGTIVTGAATYGNYRRFQTGARLIR